MALLGLPGRAPPWPGGVPAETPCPSAGGELDVVGLVGRWTWSASSIWSWCSLRRGRGRGLWVEDCWLVVVCELVCVPVPEADECPDVVELVPEPPPVSATATAPPSSTAATRNTVIQNPVRAALGQGRRHVGRAARWRGGTLAAGRSGIARVSGACPAPRGVGAWIGTVGGRSGAGSGASATVVSASASFSGSRERLLEAVAHLGGGLRPVLRRLGQHLHHELVRAPAGSRDCARAPAWARPARAGAAPRPSTSAMNGGSPVSISYSTHPSE